LAVAVEVVLHSQLQVQMHLMVKPQQFQVLEFQPDTRLVAVVVHQMHLLDPVVQAVEVPVVAVAPEAELLGKAMQAVSAPL
jgi:hypothetical protein